MLLNPTTLPFTPPVNFPSPSRSFLPSLSVPFPMYLASPSLFVFAFTYRYIYISMFIPFFSPSLRFSSPRFDSTRLDSPLDASSYINNRKLCTPRIRTANPFPSSPLDTISRSIHPRPHPPVYRGSCTWLLHGSVATGTPVHPDNGYPTCARQKTVGACERHWFSAFNEVRGSQGIEEVAFHWLFHLAKR